MNLLIFKEKNPRIHSWKGTRCHDMKKSNLVKCRILQSLLFGNFKHYFFTVHQTISKTKKIFVGGKITGKGDSLIKPSILRTSSDVENL